MFVYLPVLCHRVPDSKLAGAAQSYKMAADEEQRRDAGGEIERP